MPDPRTAKDRLDRQTANFCAAGSTTLTLHKERTGRTRREADNPQTPRHIHTVRGMGYRFSA